MKKNHNTFTLSILLTTFLFLLFTTDLKSQNIDAFNQIKAVSYSSMSGIQNETCNDTGGGQCVGYANTNDYIVFNNVDFGTGALGVDARIASGATVNGTAELHLGSVTGTLIGTIDLSNSGGWQSWVTRTSKITGATGVQNLYVVYKGGDNLGNLNWIQFSKEFIIVPVNPFAIIQAESYSTIIGAKIETCSDAGGGSAIGFIKQNGYIEFNAVDFSTGVLSVDFRFASQTSVDGTVEFHLDSVTGRNIGKVAMTNTGGWQSYTTRKAEIISTTGIHDLYLVFKGGDNLGNINWFQFSASPVPVPLAPSNVTAFFGDTFITLSWTAAYDATSFTVKKALSAEGPFETIQQGLTTPELTETGLTNGTTYYYKVSASNSTGEGEYSPVIAVTPISDANNSFVKVVCSSEKAPMSGDWFKAPMDIKYKLTPMHDLNMTAKGTTVGTVFNVDPTVPYQTMQGIGSSLEETSVYNLMLMSPEKRTEALRLLLDPVNGSGMNLMRICIGTSDFTGRPWYTYDDIPVTDTDFTLANFSIQKDIDYGIIQVIKEAIAINPNLRFFASPWSFPAWMKVSSAITGGTLKPGMYDVVALYFAKFVKAYEELGIPVWAVTLENEPGHDTGDMPSMGLNPQQEIDMVKAVKAEFIKQGIITKVWIHDHNFDNALSFPGVVLANPEAYAATDGTAFHDYGGEPTEMTKLHNLYPAKEIFFTERSVWGTSGMDRIAQYIRNWSCTYNSWVTMIDQNNKPNNGPFHCDPTFLVKGTDAADSYWTIPETYLIGQYSKFVQIGAKRISSDYGVSGGLTNVAFLNPDGNIVMVVINASSNEQLFTVSCYNKQFQGKIAAKTVGTYIWKNVPELTRVTNISLNASACIYPNPVNNDNFTISISDLSVDKAVIEFTDLSGKTLYAKDVRFEQGTSVFSNKQIGLNKGMYLMKIKTTNKTFSVKLMIAK